MIPEQTLIKAAGRFVGKHLSLFLLTLITLVATNSHAQIAGIQAQSAFSVDALTVESSASFPVSDAATGPHIEVFLISEHLSLSPGETTHVGVLLKPEALWHTYWRNPGDSGEAPVINLSSSHNLTFGEIQWPIPSAIPVAHLVNYGYEAENLLMLPVKVPADLTSSGSSNASNNAVDI